MDLYLVERICCELEQIGRLSGTDEFGDSELRYAYVIAASEDVGLDDLPTWMWP